MSTRWYPLYQRGNPQLRIFLPNFVMKLVKPNYDQPPNVVQFMVSMGMTKHDIKNYLEKIYNVPVIRVHTAIIQGPTKKDPVKGYVTKDDDYKVAYVTMPKGKEFEFPDLFPKVDDPLEDQMKQMDEMKLNHKKFLDKSKNRPGLPGWFSF